jgi:hypothetical protein
MACLIKIPDETGKGCLSFTTPERDQVIARDGDLRAAIERLKDRFVIGLHHNWHDHSFAYDPLFDFSMAGDGDLVEANGVTFPRVPIDACNFSPDCFRFPRSEPFWDVITVARAVAFKGIPEFLNAIRQIYDRGERIRVLALCPVPPAERGGSTLHDIRQRYEALFDPHERHLFTLMTMEWDYPFPLDLETLAFFYRASRIFVHSAPEERRCRTAAYAWACKMPVVAGENVASILPRDCRREPFWFRCDDSNLLADAILRAHKRPSDDSAWAAVEGEFDSGESARRLCEFLDQLAMDRGAAMSRNSVNVSRLDIRLGRHHLEYSGPNFVRQDLQALVAYVGAAPYADLRTAIEDVDPELAIAGRGKPVETGNKRLEKSDTSQRAMPRLGRGLFSFVRGRASGVGNAPKPRADND